MQPRSRGDQTRNRVAAVFFFDNLGNDVWCVLFARAQQQVLVLPEERRRESMGPCFVVVGGALNVSAF